MTKILQIYFNPHFKSSKSYNILCRRTLHSKVETIQYYTEKSKSSLNEQTVERDKNWRKPNGDKLLLY